MASYPNSIKTFTDKVDGVDIVHAAHVNDLQDEVNAIETELGTNPSAAFATVGARITSNEGRLDSIDSQLVTVLGDITSLQFGVSDLQAEVSMRRVVEGRLTLESGVPVSLGDQLAKTTLYFTPYLGNGIALYDTGTTRWVSVSATEKSISLSGKAADTNFDVFGYLSSGDLALELLAWTNASTRATALTRQDGVLVKTGDVTRRYLGTIRTTGTTGQCEDSVAKRFVYNEYNKAIRYMFLSNGTGHTYSGTYRSWNNDATLRLHLVLGTTGTITASVWGYITAAAGLRVGACLDNTNGSNVYFGEAASETVTGTYVIFDGGQQTVAPGYHFIQLTENCTGTGTFSIGRIKAGLLM